MRAPRVGSAKASRGGWLVFLFLLVRASVARYFLGGERCASRIFTVLISSLIALRRWPALQMLGVQWPLFHTFTQSADRPDINFAFLSCFIVHFVFYGYHVEATVL